MKKGYIYSRVSTEEQAKEGQSIEAQVRLCKSYAKENDIKIIDIFKDEGKTATNTNRPGLQAMLEGASTDKMINCILVLDTDRLARNTLDHLTIKSLLRKHNVDLISISQPMIDDSPEGRFIDVVLAGANALQSQITGRKTSKVMEQKAKAGWWPGMAPLAYDNIDNPSPTNSFDKRIVVPNPTLAPLVTQMFEYYLTGSFTIDGLVKKMNSLGLKSKLGSPVYVSLINDTLKNPFYYGALPWKGEILKGNHKPLISKEKWQRVQTIMDDHNQHASRKRKHNYLLRGFLFCEDCGSRYWAAPHKGRNGYVEYYYCKKCRKGTYTPVKALEKIVEKWVGLIEVSPAYAQELKEYSANVIKEERASRKSEERALTNRKKAIQQKMETAEDRLIDCTLNKDQFQRLYKRLEIELSNIEDEVNNLSSGYEDKLNRIITLVSMAVNFKDTYHNATNEEKRNYLDLFFHKILIKGGQVSDIILSETVKPYFKNQKLSIRVNTNWLPRVDSNHGPCDYKFPQSETRTISSPSPAHGGT